MKILIIEPFYTGSHASWIQGIIKNSSHDIDLIELPGRYWKWRMHGGAVTAAEMFMKSGLEPHLILASDMLDLTIFQALTRERTHSVPCAVYFHENQITYPWSPDDMDIQNKRDSHYGFINFITALTADHVLFNSHFHKNSFIKALPNFLKQFPDFNELDKVDVIERKSRVLPLGIDLSSYDKHSPESKDNDEEKPLILWNHRWEYDKNPSDFFNALYELEKRDCDFNVAVLGENFRKNPKEFSEAKERLGDRIVKYGYADSFHEYAEWLWKSDIMPVTSNQDFFGISIMEAAYCNTVPLLPERLTYPELFPEEKFGSLFYSDFDELVDRLESFIRGEDNISLETLRSNAAAYDWYSMIKVYDRTFEDMGG